MGLYKTFSFYGFRINCNNKIEWERLEISSKKIRDTKGTFHAKVGSVKDKNGMDLTEAEDIKKR